MSSAALRHRTCKLWFNILKQSPSRIVYTPYGEQGQGVASVRSSELEAAGIVQCWSTLYSYMQYYYSL